MISELVQYTPSGTSKVLAAIVTAENVEAGTVTLQVFAPEEGGTDAINVPMIRDGNPPSDSRHYCTPCDKPADKNEPKPKRELPPSLSDKPGNSAIQAKKPAKKKPAKKPTKPKAN